MVSLFLLSQVFLITKQKPLVHDLAQVILQSTTAHWENGSFVTQVRINIFAIMEGILNAINNRL